MPPLHVTTVRVSGGFAWVLPIPLLLLLTAVLAFGLAIAWVGALAATVWMGRRRLRGTALVGSERGPLTIDLDDEAYRHVDDVNHEQR